MFPVRRQSSCAVYYRASLSRSHIFQVHKQLIVLGLCDGHPVPVVDVRGRGTLGKCVVAGVGEVMAISISTIAVRQGF